MDETEKKNVRKLVKYKIFWRNVHKRNEEGDQGEPRTPLEGPKIYFRRSWNLPDYSVISLKVETSFSQFQDFHLS